MAKDRYKLPPRGASGRIPRSKIWQKGKMPTKISPKEKQAEKEAESKAEEPIQEEPLNDMFSGNPHLLFGDKPINQLHKMLFFDNKLGKPYVEKMMGGNYAAYNKIAKPETLTIDEVANISGFLGKNPVWLFCVLLSDYTNLLAQLAETPEKTATRFKRAYSLQSLSQHFRRSEGLHHDAQTALSLISELLPSTRHKADPDSQDEQ